MLKHKFFIFEKNVNRKTYFLTVFALRNHKKIRKEKKKKQDMRETSVYNHFVLMESHVYINISKILVFLKDFQI